jgi:hypothetical protein
MAAQMTLLQKLESGLAARRAEMYHFPLARCWGELAKVAEEIMNAEALAAFQRYKETAWLDVPATTLNELLHLIQTKEHQRGVEETERNFSCGIACNNN